MNGRSELLWRVAMLAVDAERQGFPLLSEALLMVLRATAMPWGVKRALRRAAEQLIAVAEVAGRRGGPA